MSLTPRDIVFEGTFDEIQDHFEALGWSDGLPIVPPTVEAVERFLAFTDRDPDEILGVLQPNRSDATIWGVAVNGVMAGCRPEYMPILIAIVEILADPEFRLEDAGSTPGWEPLVIVSGPIVEQLNFNYEAGAMRTGRRANSTVGRFVRLLMRTVAGFQIPPGNTDKGSIGQPFNVAMAESPVAVRELSWPSFAEAAGYPPGTSLVTMQSVLAITPPIYTAGRDARRHLDALATTVGNVAKIWTYIGLTRGEYHVTLLMCPIIAKRISEAGITREEVQFHIHDTARISPWELERYYWWHSGNHDFGGVGDKWHVQHLMQFVEGAAERLPQPVHEEPLFEWSTERTIPVFPWPENIRVVVAGDPGRNQTRAFINNHRQGPPTSRVVELFIKKD